MKAFVSLFVGRVLYIFLFSATYLLPRMIFSSKRKMPKLTKRIIDLAMPEEKALFIWDTELKGFCCKITLTGKKSYFLFYRTSHGRQRKPKIGDHGAITCEQARDMEQQWLAAVARGEDPSAEKQRMRRNPTIKELSQRYMIENAPHKNASSCKEGQRLWDQYILPLFGSLKVSSLARKDILELHHSLKDKPTTANRLLSLLSKSFNLAEL